MGQEWARENLHDSRVGQPALEKMRLAVLLSVLIAIVSTNEALEIKGPSLVKRENGKLSFLGEELQKKAEKQEDDFLKKKNELAALEKSLPQKRTRLVELENELDRVKSELVPCVNQEKYTFLDKYLSEALAKEKQLKANMTAAETAIKAIEAALNDRKLRNRPRKRKEKEAELENKRMELDQLETYYRLHMVDLNLFKDVQKARDNYKAAAKEIPEIEKKIITMKDSSLPLLGVQKKQIFDAYWDQRSKDLYNPNYQSDTFIQKLDDNASAEVMSILSNAAYYCDPTTDMLSFERSKTNIFPLLKNRGGSFTHRRLKTYFPAGMIFKNDLCNDNRASYQHYSKQVNDGKRWFFRDVTDRLPIGVDSNFVFTIQEWDGRSSITRKLIFCGMAKHNSALAGGNKNYDMC